MSENNNAPENVSPVTSSETNNTGNIPPVAPSDNNDQTPSKKDKIPTSIESKPVPKGPTMVTVSEAALLDLQKQIIELNKKVEQTVDRTRLADFKLKQNQKITPTCRINYYRDTNGDRLIMGWGNMISNKAKYGKNFEQVDQRVVLFLRDLTKNENGELKYKDGIVALEVDYVSSFQNKSQEEVEIIATTNNSDGRTIFKVLKPDGEEIEIDSRFIN